MILGQRFQNLPTAQKLVWALLLTMMLLWPYVLVLSHRSISIVFTVGALFCLLLPEVRQNLWAAFGKAKNFTLLFALGFALYVSLSTLWAPDFAFADDGPRLFMMVLNGFFLLTAASIVRPEFSKLYFLFALLAVLAIGFESVTGGWVRDILPPDNDPARDDVATGRGTSIGLFLLPALWLMIWQGVGVTGFLSWRGKALLMGLTFILMAVGAVRFGIAANLLAILALLAVWLMALRFAKSMLNMVFITGLALLVLTPFLFMALPSLEDLNALEQGPASWRMRLVIWKYTAGEIFADPAIFLFGHGVNATKALTEASPIMTLPGAPPDAHMLPTHPHNLFLQIWFEYGLVGVGLISGFFIAMWQAFSRLAGTDRLCFAAIASLFAMFLVFSAVEASLWTQWRLVSPVFGVWGILLALPNQRST
jgi:O-antigen ligase